MAFPINLTNAVDFETDILADHINNLEAKVGVDGSLVTTSLDNLVKAAENPGHTHTPSTVGLSGVTNDAQLKRASGDFAGFSEKTTPVSADLLLIEDSEANGAKKKMQIGNLPGGSSLPDQTGHDGEALVSNGVTADWGPVTAGSAAWDHITSKPDKYLDDYAGANGEAKLTAALTAIGSSAVTLHLNTNVTLTAPLTQIPDNIKLAPVRGKFLTITLGSTITTAGDIEFVNFKWIVDNNIGWGGLVGAGSYEVIFTVSGGNITVTATGDGFTGFPTGWLTDGYVRFSGFTNSVNNHSFGPISSRSLNSFVVPATPYGGGSSAITETKDYVSSYTPGFHFLAPGPARISPTWWGLTHTESGTCDISVANANTLSLNRATHSALNNYDLPVLLPLGAFYVGPYLSNDQSMVGPTPGGPQTWSLGKGCQLAGHPNGHGPVINQGWGNLENIQVQMAVNSMTGILSKGPKGTVTHNFYIVTPETHQDPVDGLICSPATITVNTTTKRITRSEGDFVQDGWLAGRKVTFTGDPYVNSPNLGKTVTVATVTSDYLVYSESGILSNETATAGLMIYAGGWKVYQTAGQHKTSNGHLLGACGGIYDVSDGGIISFLDIEGSGYNGTGIYAGGSQVIGCQAQYHYIGIKPVNSEVKILGGNYQQNWVGVGGYGAYGSFAGSRIGGNIEHGTYIIGPAAIDFSECRFMNPRVDVMLCRGVVGKLRNCHFSYNVNYDTDRNKFVTRGAVNLEALDTPIVDNNIGIDSPSEVTTGIGAQPPVPFSYDETMYELYDVASCTLARDAQAWSPGLSNNFRDLVKSSTGAAFFQSLNAGAAPTAGTEPTWNYNEGENTVDGGTIWKCVGKKAPITLTRAAGSWITAGVAPGDRVWVQYNSAGGQDFVGWFFTVRSVTALVITFVPDDAFDSGYAVTSYADTMHVRKVPPVHHRDHFKLTAGTAFSVPALEDRLAPEGKQITIEAGVNVTLKAWESLDVTKDYLEVYDSSWANVASSTGWYPFKHGSAPAANDFFVIWTNYPIRGVEFTCDVAAVDITGIQWSYYANTGFESADWQNFNTSDSAIFSKTGTNKVYFPPLLLPTKIRGNDSEIGGWGPRHYRFAYKCTITSVGASPASPHMNGKLRVSCIKLDNETDFPVNAVTAYKRGATITMRALDGVWTEISRSEVAA